MRGWENSGDSKWRRAIRQTDYETDKEVRANLANGGSMMWDSDGVRLMDSGGIRVPGKEHVEKEIYMSIVDDSSGDSSSVIGLSGDIEDANENVRVDTREVTVTAEERERATKAREVHGKQGHPSSEVLIKALDNEVYEGMEGFNRKGCKECRHYIWYLRCMRRCENDGSHRANI